MKRLFSNSVMILVLSMVVLLAACGGGGDDGGGGGGCPGKVCSNCGAYGDCNITCPQGQVQYCGNFGYSSDPNYRCTYCGNP
jgi:hypothetical protein